MYFLKYLFSVILFVKINIIIHIFKLAIIFYSYILNNSITNYANIYQIYFWLSNIIYYKILNHNTIAKSTQKLTTKLQFVKKLQIKCYFCIIEKCMLVSYHKIEAAIS